MGIMRNLGGAQGASGPAEFNESRRLQSNEALCVCVCVSLIYLQDDARRYFKELDFNEIYSDGTQCTPISSLKN